MKRSRVNTLFLDIGGVLLNDGWGRKQRHQAIEKFGLDKNETDNRHGLIWDTCELGKLTLDDYLHYVVFYQQRKFSKKQFVAFMFEQSEPMGEAIEYFKVLKKEKGCKIVALSNEIRELNDYRIKTFKLNELFDFYISSCYVHLRKPDPEIYKLAYDTSRALPEEAVYIDDRLTYIEMATKQGVQSLHYRDISSVREYFEKTQNA